MEISLKKFSELDDEAGVANVLSLLGNINYYLKSNRLIFVNHNVIFKSFLGTLELTILFSLYLASN